MRRTVSILSSSRCLYTVPSLPQEHNPQHRVALAEIVNQSHSGLYYSRTAGQLETDEAKLPIGSVLKVCSLFSLLHGGRFIQVDEMTKMKIKAESCLGVSERELPIMTAQLAPLLHMPLSRNLRSDYLSCQSI